MVFSFTGAHMELETLRSDWVKLSATNLTTSFDANFAKSLVAINQGSSLQPPATGNFINMNPQGSKVTNSLLLRFFGTDTNNETLNARIWGLSPWYDKVNAKFSWEFALLAQLAMTLGNIQGTAGCMITATDFEVDTYAVTYGAENVNVYVVSPANGLRGAHVVVDNIGFGLVAIEGDLNSSAVSWNCGYKRQ